MIGAGKLDRRIQLQSASTSNDSDTNELVPSWSTYATVWGRKEHHKETEGQAQAQGSAQGVRYAGMDMYITIRHRSDVEPSHRVIVDGETYTVEGFPRELGRREYIKFMVRRVE